MDKDKAIGLFRLRIANTMTPFHMHGMDVHIKPVIEEIVKAALVLHKELEERE